MIAIKGKMSRKGNVPMIILFIASFAIFTSALLIFYSFNDKLLVSSKDVADSAVEVNLAYNYVNKISEILAREAIKENGNNGNADLKAKFQELALSRDGLRVDSFGNYFGKIRAGDFTFVKNGDGYVLEINGIFVHSVKGENKIKRNFDIRVEFDSLGRMQK